jgi:glycerol transport system ATP-binding protein
MVFEDGGAYALLGPSGCGKTTMLNIMSGLLVPSQGRVLFDGKDMTHATPQERNIAQVFQFPVIYDTMTVAENLAFPLKNRRMPADRIRERVQFDEPLTVIDPQLKWQLRRKLKQIHHELRLTLIYVTHDQVEALTFADQVVVMTRGRAVQVGTPAQLFERPSHAFVGHFIGSPGMNFVPLQQEDGRLLAEGQYLPVPAALANVAPGQPLSLGIRPEYLALASADAPGAVACTVERVQDVGTHQLLVARLGGRLLKLRCGADAVLPAVGETVWVQLQGPHTCYYLNEELQA